MQHQELYSLKTTVFRVWGEVAMPCDGFVRPKVKECAGVRVSGMPGLFRLAGLFEIWPRVYKVGRRLMRSCRAFRGPKT